MVRAADRAGRAGRASVWLAERAGGGTGPGASPGPAATGATSGSGTTANPGPGPGTGPRARARRSDQPSGLDRERITAATVRLLDEEGLSKFSMRRLAAELDVTAMSVYWYVDTKDDLLELALDAVMAELLTGGPEAEAEAEAEAETETTTVSGAQAASCAQAASGAPAGAAPVPGPGTPAGAISPAGADWRVRLRALASGYRSMIVRHPWVSPLMGSFLNIGPHSQAFSRRLRAVLRDTGMTPAEQLGALSAVFRFVYGFGTIEGHFVRRCASAGMSQDEYYRDALGSMSRRPEFVESFGSTEEIFGTQGFGGVEDLRERDFAFALDLLVAGIEAQAGKAAPAREPVSGRTADGDPAPARG
ncbi:TetR/AcrR family transcriptional regulator [Streptomyces sp. NPDC007088]|uniref:TetR/AcrR family transcriptional regulator n=1 Tax=Streptomyces sp. NPDC007088 TaxID=3364773 RepID=UPI0036C5C70A